MSDEPASEVPEVPEAQQPRLTCWYCRGRDITKGLQLGLSAEVGAAGTKYEAIGRALGAALLGLESLRVSLCNDCGTVVRLSVRETDHKWS